jgi:hypothetical protein
MGFLRGSNAAVKLGSDTVVGMGTWELPGISVDLLDSTAFGDTAKQYMTGMLDYGNVNFGGLYDAADTTGQNILISANINNSAVNVIRLYVDNTSYWTPNKTVASGGLSDSGMLVQSISIGMDKSGLGTIKFTGKCTGPWALVAD